jgi:hypothetical protein
MCHDNSLMTRKSPIIIVIALWSFLYSDVPLCQLDPELTTAPSLKRSISTRNLMIHMGHFIAVN